MKNKFYKLLITCSKKPYCCETAALYLTRKDAIEAQKDWLLMYRCGDGCSEFAKKWQESHGDTDVKIFSINIDIENL